MPRLEEVAGELKDVSEVPGTLKDVEEATDPLAIAEVEVDVTDELVAVVEDVAALVM